MPRKIIVPTRISFGSVNKRRIVLPNTTQAKKQTKNFRKLLLQKRKMLRDSSLKAKTSIHKEEHFEIIIAGEPLVPVSAKVVAKNWVIKSSKGIPFTATLEDNTKAMFIPRILGEKGFLAFEEGRGIGLFGKMRTIFIVSVLTPLEARGKGHGDELFARVEREARKRKIGWVYGNCLREDEKTLRFLQRRGWREIEAPRARAGLQDYQVVMAKRIRL